MKAEELIKELGRNLGVALELSPVGTCRASFDGDVVEFEKTDDALWIYAELGSAMNREDASQSLLAANRLGIQTGGATISLDEERSQFVMHVEMWGDMPYESFESRLVLFIKALRWWKEWLALPPLKSVVRTAHSLPVGFQPVGGEADGIMQDVYAPMGMGGMIRV
jgi:hypothetical protein